jgi:hypothetical protein
MSVLSYFKSPYFKEEANSIFVTMDNSFGPSIFLLKTTVFWVVLPHSLEKAQRFGRKYRIHLQSQRGSQAINLHNQATSSAGFFLGLFFDIGDRSGIFLRNTRFSPNYMVVLYSSWSPLAEPQNLHALPLIFQHYFFHWDRS